ncbi:MAG TPA: TetR/AcrR family transcriptional regulator [Solirubrobacterales bacterium]|nr:TetR/AcrR family transcriptional regulator [Solirubrobacterales bacterium]
MSTPEARAASVDRPSGKLSPGPGLAQRDVAAHQLARIHRATVGIVAEEGYKALKVRDVVRRAEVSTRAFYEHFGSKEDCFLQTYELIARRASRRIIAAQAGESDWRKRPQLAFEEFSRELEKEPAQARLALIEAYAVGNVSLERAWRVERIFEGMLAESLARPPSGVRVPPLIIEGMVGGIIHISRKYLLANEVTELSAASSDLVEWALSYPDPSASQLTKLDQQSVWRDTMLEPLKGAFVTGSDPWPATGDRAIILAATAELSVKSGYSNLTVARIRSAARVSRRKFEAYFDDLEDCYLAAIEQHVGEAMAQAARAQAAARSWPGGVYRAITALCDHIADDQFLARLCLTDDFPPGPNGTLHRQRFTEALTELLTDQAPQFHTSRLTTEASAGALWSLFHHHLIRDWALRRRISATLSYLALAPVVGAPAAIGGIQNEQHA